jgi:hypothetical protein
VDEKRDTYQYGLGERHEPGMKASPSRRKEFARAFVRSLVALFAVVFDTDTSNWSPVVNVPPPLTTTRATNHRCDQRKRASRPDDRLPPDFVTFAATFGIAFFVAFFVVFFAAALATRGRS